MKVSLLNNLLFGTVALFGAKGKLCFIAACYEGRKCSLQLNVVAVKTVGTVDKVIIMNY